MATDSDVESDDDGASQQVNSVDETGRSMQLASSQERAKWIISNSNCQQDHIGCQTCSLYGRRY